MVIYLIGPSGVGKSCCARYASTVLAHTEHADIDALCSGRQFDWPTCMRVLDAIQSGGNDKGVNIIADIGAGTQTRAELTDYLYPKKARVILIIAPAQEVIRRNPLGPDRSLAEYRETEYSSRIRMYSLASHRIDITEKSTPEAQRIVVQYILRAFPDWEEGPEARKTNR